MAVPERMCVGCRGMKPKSELLRFVKDEKTGEPVFDKRQKILSRGIYVCCDEKCIAMAKKKKAFERFFKNTSYETLYDTLTESIKRGEINE
ncbi:MAG: YlxR family protein [Firmicutes bacterium]|nr:YlxR family protein [Bacillota bacterium]